MKKLTLSFLFAVLFCGALTAQVPVATGIQILRAEDARRYDAALENLIKSPRAFVRARAALAAGRIGDEKAIAGISALLVNDPDTNVRGIAAFALGEIESLNGADAILKILADPRTPMSVVARAVEAAGKIAGINAKGEKVKSLGVAIIDCLNTQLKMKLKRDNAVSRLALTAALRAKPDGVEAVVAQFLTDMNDPRIRADAANTLARLGAKNANETLRKMLASDTDVVARANAARALGVAEDKNSFDMLLKAAISDSDSRVRVSAIRSVGGLKDPKAADKLLESGEKLLTEYKRSRFKHPAEKSELIEISTVLGRLLAGTENARAIKFIDEFARLDNGYAAEISIARIRIKPQSDYENSTSKNMGWHEMSTDAQFLGAMADIEPKTADAIKVKQEAPDLLFALLALIRSDRPIEDKNDLKAMPDVLTAYAAYNRDDLDQVLRLCLERDDVQLRATAAGLLADRPASQENLDSLNVAFDKAIQTDKDSDDAALATLDALFKLDRRKSLSALAVASGSSDYLVRKKALGMLKDVAFKNVDTLPQLLAVAQQKKLDQVLPYLGSGSKLGVVLNTDADYRRALSRIAGSIKAVLTTEKGVFTVVFNPEEAPLTVDNWVKLARSGYFNGLEVHRVVPNFVMQDGDPRGDGNGGPGWSIRCEVNMLPYDRGAVGMALSGKDTGGSQWFVTHSRQPHLDGGYTVFGHVNEVDMKVVDNIVRGDRIISVKIVEGSSPRRHVGH